MKKPDNYRNIRLQRRRELRNLRRKNASYTASSSVNKQIAFLINQDNRTIENFKAKCNDFLPNGCFIDEELVDYSGNAAPRVFSLSENYRPTMQYIAHVIQIIRSSLGSVVNMDFSKCQLIDQDAIFLLQVLRIELNDRIETLSSKLKYLKVKVTFNVTPSESTEVNNALALGGLYPDARNSEWVPIDTLGYMKGSSARRHYLENLKAVHTRRVRNYVDACLRKQGYYLDTLGGAQIDGLISEILNNAEDHSPHSSYYVTAHFELSKHTKNLSSEWVGRLTLCVLNFGYSIFDGIEATREQSPDQYANLMELYAAVSQNKNTSHCTKENIFTLLSLQDGVSRLKGTDISRGTGTVKFINSFFSLGDYEDMKRGYRPQIMIISGKSCVRCDNEYKSFQRGSSWFISMNAEEDLRKPPSSRHVFSVPLYFPGTLLSVRVLIDKGHLDSKRLNYGREEI